MASQEYIIGLVLVFVGLTLSVIIALPVLWSFRQVVRSQSQNSRIRRAKEKLELIDELIDSLRHGDALSEIQSAFIFDTLDTRESVLILREHNENVLSRCVIVSEARGKHIENIAQLERLILQQAEMQLARFRTDSGFEKLREKRAKQNKQLPAWTEHNRDRRHSELAEAINRNRCECEKAIESLVQQLTKEASAEVVYH